MPKKPANKLRLKSVTIDGFKSLRGVTIPFDERATVLIGPNGSGKSTVLQALEFVWHFARGTLRNFFSDRGFQSNDVVNPKDDVSFSIEFSKSDGGLLLWTFTFPSDRRQAREELSLKYENNDPIILVSTSAPKPEVTLRPGSSRQLKFIALSPGGSILPVLVKLENVDEELLDDIKALTSWIAGVFFVRALDSESIRYGRGIVRGFPEGGEINIDTLQFHGIGVNGATLFSFIHTLSDHARSRLNKRISDLSPQVDLISTIEIAPNTVDFAIRENFGRQWPISSAHISDGTLRLVAIAALAELPAISSFVAIDEVENGIDPHIIEKLIRSVVKDCDQQFLFTSHSPDLVNHFGPDQIVVLARDDDGRTLAAPMSAMPKAVKGMKYAGPAVIWTHASLKTLSRWVKEASLETAGTP